MVFILSRPLPGWGNADTAGETHSAVYHQQLAVRAVIEAGQVVPGRFVKLADVHTGVFHLLEQRFVHLAAANPVHQYVYLDPGSRPLCQRIGKF